LPKVWTIQQEEIYQFKNYDPAKVHDLLILDKHPETGALGHYAVSWSKDYGAGKVFYTSLGHREDIWDIDPNLQDRKNSTEIKQSIPGTCSLVELNGVGFKKIAHVPLVWSSLWFTTNAT